jgi:hypothetical protein
MYDSESQTWLDTLQEPVPQTKRRGRKKFISIYVTEQFSRQNSNSCWSQSIRFLFVWAPTKKTMYSAPLGNKRFISALFIPAQPFATAPGYLKGPYIHWFTCWTLLASVVNFDLINIRSARGGVYCRSNVSDVRETLHRYGICVKREKKTNKIQQLDVYY